MVFFIFRLPPTHLVWGHALIPDILTENKKPVKADYLDKPIL
jgi:hypothetical protein